ncbi:MAG: hypothetical protein ABR549_04430 [Mycobacteriales bacterium]
MDDPATEPLRPPGRTKTDPVAQVKAERLRDHPVGYAALALSLIALLWLAILSASSGDDGYQKVRVGSQDCVSVPQDTGPAGLYCRTAGIADKP